MGSHVGTVISGKQISFSFWGFCKPAVMETWSNSSLRDKTLKSTENRSYSVYLFQPCQVNLGVIPSTRPKQFWDILFQKEKSHFPIFSSKREQQQQKKCLQHYSILTSYFWVPTWTTVRVWKSQFNQRSELRTPPSTTSPSQQPPAEPWSFLAGKLRRPNEVPIPSLPVI